MSKDEEGYNGWDNYETWNINLWLDNDESTQELFSERALELLLNNEEEEDSPEYELSNEIQSFIEEGNPITDASVYSDLLQAAIGSANFYEIAEHYISDAEETDEYKEFITEKEKGEEDSGK